jgi:hypothetical protein
MPSDASHMNNPRGLKDKQALIDAGIDFSMDYRVQDNFDTMAEHVETKAHTQQELNTHLYDYFKESWSIGLAGVHFLAERGADLGASHEVGESLATMAALMNDTKLLRYLAANGHTLDQASQNGNTPAHAAVRSGSADILRIIIESGGSIDKPNADGQTPFQQYVASPDQIQVFHQTGLYEKYHDHLFEGQSYLYHAGIKGHTGVIDRLADLGENVFAVDAAGTTLTHAAALASDETFILSLHKHGADLSVKDRDGLTPIDFIIRSRNWGAFPTVLDLPEVDLSQRPSARPYRLRDRPHRSGG